jgi:hypothetical protein
MWMKIILSKYLLLLRILALGRWSLALLCNHGIAVDVGGDCITCLTPHIISKAIPAAGRESHNVVKWLGPHAF